MDFSKAILKEQVFSSFFSFYGLGLWNKSMYLCKYLCIYFIDFKTIKRQFAYMIDEVIL